MTPRDGKAYPWWRAPLAPGVLLLIGAGTLTRPADLPPQRHVVEIQGMTFRPAVLEVNRGDTLVWINRDMVPHTATRATEPSWSTGILAQGQSGQHVPDAGGTISYFCELHPVMRGKLIVR